MSPQEVPKNPCVQCPAPPSPGVPFTYMIAASEPESCICIHTDTNVDTGIYLDLDLDIHIKHIHTYTHMSRHMGPTLGYLEPQGSQPAS